MSYQLNTMPKSVSAQIRLVNDTVPNLTINPNTLAALYFTLVYMNNCCH